MKFSQKSFSIIAILTLLTACGSSNNNVGAGFGGSSTVSQPALTATTSSRKLAEGTYRTAGGAPWLVYDSTNAKRGRSPLSQSIAMREAVKYGSHRWSAPDAIKLVEGQNSGLFRVVTVDGHTFGVLKKLKTPGFWPDLERQRLASEQLLRKGLRFAQCNETGTMSMRSNSQSVVNASLIPAKC